MPGMVSLFLRHVDGLSDLRNARDGAPRWGVRWTLVLVPAAIAGLVIWREWDLRPAAGSLIGGFALVAGVLIAVFAQFAAWRTRLDERARFRQESEAPARRAVDAAAAHALWGVVTNVLSVAVAVVLEVGTPIDRWIGGVVAFLGVYGLGLLLVITSAAFVGYESNVEPGVREADRDLQRPEQPRPARRSPAA